MKKTIVAITAAAFLGGTAVTLTPAPASAMYPIFLAFAKPDPNFKESNLKVISFDPSTGTFASYPTTLDQTNKTATAHVESLAPVYSLAVLEAFTQRTLDFPVFQSFPGFDTQLSFVNSSMTAVALNSQGFDSKGASFSGSGVTNPVSTSLPAGQQLTRAATQLFNLNAGQNSGWIQTRANNNQVFGYQLLGSGDRLDGRSPLPRMFR